jgi:GcrA cell cycle regulator
MANWWSDEAVARAKALWPDHTCSQIVGILASEKLGEFSRNAVIGKLHRLGLTSNDKTETDPTTRTAFRAPRVKRADKPVGSTAFKVIFGIKRQQKGAPSINADAFACKDIADIEPRNLSLLDPALGPNDCRWPTTASLPHLFCGLPKWKGSYCHAHFKLSIGEGTASERAADKVSKAIA